MPLRRDVVNDITHIVQHESENEVLKDWSDFNFPDIYGDEMDAYEQRDATKACAHNNATDSSSCKEDNVSVLSQDADAFTLSPLQKTWTIALLKLLDDMNAPDYTFEAIIKCCHHFLRWLHYSQVGQGGVHGKSDACGQS
jgi:hypothetical protein